MKTKIIIGVLAIIFSLVIGFFIGMIMQNGGIDGLFGFIRTGQTDDKGGSLAGKVVTVGENTANVYAAADAKSEVIYSLSPGETATCIKEGETWLELEIFEGITGYAHTRLFSVAEDYAPIAETEPKAIETPETTYVTPTVNVLDIYAGESNKEEIVGTVEHGDVLELLAKGETWSQVKTLDGISGYVLASDIATTTYDPDAAVVEVVNSFVNLRAEPSTDSKKLGSMSRGDTAEFLGEEDDFYKIKTEDGTECYVSKDYTKVVNGGEAAADDSDEE